MTATSCPVCAGPQEVLTLPNGEPFVVCVKCDGPLEHDRRRGWPRILVCLRCGKPRLATRPNDRLHVHCALSAADFDPLATKW